MKVTFHTIGQKITQPIYRLASLADWGCRNLLDTVDGWLMTRILSQDSQLSAKTVKVIKSVDVNMRSNLKMKQTSLESVAVTWLSFRN